MPLIVDIKELIDDGLRARTKRLKGALNEVASLAKDGSNYCSRGITSPKQARDLASLDGVLRRHINDMIKECDSWSKATEEVFEAAFRNPQKGDDSP